MSEVKHDQFEGYKHISSVVEETKHRLNSIREGRIKPLFTSSEKERLTIGGYLPSDQIVIAARTGTGKTAKILSDLADFFNPAINPYYAENAICLYDSWEMPAWRNILRLISRVGEVQAKVLIDYARKLEDEKFARFMTIADHFKHLPIYISQHSTSVNTWEERKKQIQGKYPKKIIINMFDHTRLVLKSTESREEELITNLMLAGMRLKNNFNMINIFVSQMNRNIETGVQRKDMGMYTPVASDIFGSDAVFQCADIVMALHRPGLYGVELFDGIPTGIDKSDPNKVDNLLIECILKQRDGWTGNLMMEHNLSINKIKDYNIEEIKKLAWS